MTDTVGEVNLFPNFKTMVRLHQKNTVDTRWSHTNSNRIAAVTESRLVATATPK
jgi:hypothetical protein